MVTIYIQEYNDAKEAQSFNDEEWQIVQGIIEDCLEFYAGLRELMDESESDAIFENTQNVSKINSELGKKVLGKLNKLGINVKELDK